MSEKFDKDGLVLIKEGKWIGKGDKKKLKRNKKWKESYFNLIGGSLYIYKNIDAADPTHGFTLKEVVFKSRVEDLKPDPIFSISNDTTEILILTEDEESLKEWVSAIEDNKNKAARPPLTKEKKLGRLGNLRERTKKGVANKAVASPVGKKAIRAKAPKEVTNLIGAIKKIIRRESNSQKKANEIEENIFKIGVKCYLLMSARKVTMGELLQADKPLRSALDGFSKCYYHVIDYADDISKVKTKQVKEKLAQVQELVQKASNALVEMLSPHLTAKSIARVKSTMDYLGNADTLYKVLMDTALHEDLGELVMAGEHYSQFHFYADDKFDLPPL